MADILNFPDRQKPINNVPVIVHNIKNRKEYLMMCKEVLTEEDYFDVCRGILDDEYYEILDEPLKKIVSVYFTHI